LHIFWDQFSFSLELHVVTLVTQNHRLEYDTASDTNIQGEIS